MVGLALLATSASAQQVSPTPPPPPVVTIGPGAGIQPPPPPVLPTEGTDGREKHGGQHDDGGEGGKATQAGTMGRQDAGTDLQASCGPFDFVQTYSTWGPALSYGRPVTVTYSAMRCSTPRGAALDLSVEGIAAIHEAPTAGGALIEEKPFSVIGTWTRPGNDSGWPPDWWQCGVRRADYVWQIADIYTFHVAALDGAWSLEVLTQGPAPKTVTWSYDAC